MTIVKNMESLFVNNLEKLGFYKDDDSLFLIKHEKQYPPPPQVIFHINKAKEFSATAVYLRKLPNGNYQPQVYLYDFTDLDFSDEDEVELTNIQKKIWSSGELPLACIFYKTEIKILNCATHIKDNDEPVYLIKNLNIIGKAHKLYNEQFAIKIKSGLFWDEQEVGNKFKFSNNSSYTKLIENINFIVSKFIESNSNLSRKLINKIIVQSILIKYLEERIDGNGNKLLSDKYFKKFNNSKTFNDVLKKGNFTDLLAALNDPQQGFNGNVFQWTVEEQVIVRNIDLSILAELLETKKTNLESLQEEINFPNWRYFEFKYIPVELISRLYEEFLGSNKKGKGLYYTPAHLTKLLVDESLPLAKYKEINIDTYKVLDPACGSGIFLVITFKRLVQIWRLQNNMKLPSLNILKGILKNIYGVDKEEQAIQLASFSLSLALCNELEPIKIINELKFDDLRDNNLIRSDFFELNQLKSKKFDLIIGNPPFIRGAIKQYSKYWDLGNRKVKIPQGQIALKFLSESLPYLKDKGLLCLIVKSSGLLYNSTSEEFKKALFSNFNVIQILDFTALARNKSLWDNDADVATAAIFIKNEKQNINKNILHLTFRRTKATKERIIFEIDDYDLHFVDRKTAIEDPFVWKNNLLGGGRIRLLIEKTQKIMFFKEYLKENDFVHGEGFIKGTNGELSPTFIYNLPTLPTEAITEKQIDYSQLTKIDKNIKFVKIPKEILFKAPNIIIKENIGNEKIPIFFNERNFSYKHKLIGIASKKGNSNLLKSIVKSFNNYSDFYRFYIFVTSSQTLINLNTVILKKDLMTIPFINPNNKFHFSKYDKKIIDDVNIYMQDFLRHGENSKAVKPILNKNFESVLSNYGKEFSKVLNLIYEDDNMKFRLSDVVKLKNSFVATIFKYDHIIQKPVFHSDNSNINIKELSNYEISKQLSVNRIIKLYPTKDTIIFIKPNQNRYWLSLIAYRDADKCFADLSDMGY